MKQFVGHPSQRTRALFDPRVPLMSGVVQNQDAYMKGKIAQRRWYDRVLPTLKAVMDEYTRLTGRKYDVVMPYRLEDADYAIVGSGCMIETAEATVDYIREHMGVKVGLLHITCWRPFPSIEIVEALRHCKAISVIERLDIPMMQSNPLLCEIKAAFADSVSGTPGYPELDRVPRFFGGSAGLGSRDVRAGDFIAIVDNMRQQQPSDVLHARHQARDGPADHERSRRTHAGFVFDARPFGRRLRFGHDEQSHRHHRRRSVRHGCAGVSEIRIGKEGPADDVLPHHRKRSHPGSLRTRKCRIHPPQRRERVQSGKSSGRTGR